jgi:hypothetical protein
MTPKEKAKELVEDMHDAPEIGYNEHAKQCALVAVDEIIDALAEYDNRNNTYELQNMDRDFNYWQEVKKEIEAL